MQRRAAHRRPLDLSRRRSDAGSVVLPCTIGSSWLLGRAGPDQLKRLLTLVGRETNGVFGARCSVLSFVDVCVVEGGVPFEDLRCTMSATRRAGWLTSGP